MKRVAIIYLFFLQSLCNGQVVDAYIYGDTFTVSSTCATLGNHIFMNKSRGEYFDYNLSNQHILKLNLELKVVDSLDLESIFNIPRGHSSYCHKLREEGDNELVGILNERYERVVNGKTIYYSKMYVFVLDSNLIVKNQFTFNSDSVYLRLNDVDVYEDTLYFTGFVTDTFFKNIQNLMVKASKNGGYIKSRTYNDSLFIDNPLLDHLYFQGNRIIVSLASSFNGADRFVILDRHLQFIRTITPRDSSQPLFFFPASGFFVDDGMGTLCFISSLALVKQPDPSHAAYPGTIPYFAMGVGQLDSLLNVIKIDSFPFSGFDWGYYINPKPYFDAFDYVKPDSVIIIMPGQEIFASNFALQDTNDMYIYNYNAVTKSMNWIKVYNNGYSNSAISAVEVLPGNRYLIMLNEYNWDKYNYPNTSIHLMILDSKGNIIGDEEHPYLRNHLTVYPNPFSHELRVEGLPEQARPFSYKLYNMSGKELESGQLPEDGTITSTSHQTGSYILQILDEGKVYQNIPVIKK
jgi:hypothetical protein